MRNTRAYDGYLIRLINEDYLSYQVFFIMNFFIIFFLMKIMNWILYKKIFRPDFLEFLFTTPLLSTRAFARTKNRKDPLSILVLKFILSLFFLICIIFISKNFLQPLNYFKIVMISPTIYLFTEFMGSLGQLLFYPLPNGIAAIHKNPLASKTLGEFWGKRWNFWVRDWLIDVSEPYKKIILKKLGMTFLVSGLFHELMVNLPHFIYYGENYFGNMTLYFGIQALGIWIEKKCLYTVQFFSSRLYLWALVILPAPIFINRPLLIFFGIING